MNVLLEFWVNRLGVMRSLVYMHIIAKYFLFLIASVYTPCYLDLCKWVTNLIIGPWGYRFDCISLERVIWISYCSYQICPGYQISQSDINSYIVTIVTRCHSVIKNIIRPCQINHPSIIDTQLGECDNVTYDDWFIPCGYLLRPDTGCAVSAVLGVVAVQAVGWHLAVDAAPVKVIQDGFLSPAVVVIEAGVVARVVAPLVLVALRPEGEQSRKGLMKGHWSAGHTKHCPTRLQQTFKSVQQRKSSGSLFKHINLKRDQMLN